MDGSHTESSWNTYELQKKKKDTPIRVMNKFIYKSLLE